VRLELLRNGRGNATSSELREWAQEAASRLNNADSERLLSRIIQLTLEYDASLALSLGVTSQIMAQQLYDPKRGPDCAAHREAPPLFASVAEALLVRGISGEASRLVNNVLNVPNSSQDDEAIKAAKLITLRTTRRMRWNNSLPLTFELINIEQELSTQFHRWWATQVATTDEATAKLIDAAIATIERQGPNVFHRSDGTIDAFSALDAYELDLLAKRIGRSTNYSNGLQVNDETSIKKETGAIDPRLALRRFALHRGKKPNLPNEHTQPRVIAEIALEEAELLALRLPRQANWLFQRAATLFLNAHDSFGALRAVLGGALAAASLDGTSAARTIDRVKQLYGRCRDELDQLLEWDEIEPLGLDHFKNHAWFDWLLRIARLKAWAVEPQGGAITDEVNKIIAECYGEQPQFDLLPGTSAKESVPDSRKRERIWPFILISIALIVVFIGAVVFGFIWLWHHPVVVGIGTIIVGAIVLVLLAYFKMLLPILRRTLFIVRRPRVLLQADSSGEQLLVRFEADPTKPAFLRFVHPIGMDLHSVELTTRAQLGYESYHEVAPGFALEPLKRMRDTISAAKLPIMLIVDRNLEHYAWEAPFDIAARGKTPSASLQLVRSGKLLSLPQGLTEWASSSVHITCRSSLGHTFEDAWQKMERPIDLNTSGEFAPPADGKSLRVMHLVGASTSTRSGPVFSITRHYEDESTTSVSFSGFNVSPAIVIVQEEPVERIRRLDIDREQTALTRAWAAEIFRSHGLQTVILIPPLPLALTRRMIETIAKGLRREQPPDIFKLLDVVTSARKAIASFRPPAASPDEPDLRADMKSSELKQALRELSLEITVFSRSTYFKADDQDNNEYFGFATT
jgi:hypothetical protein